MVMATISKSTVLAEIVQNFIILQILFFQRKFQLKNLSKLYIFNLKNKAPFCIILWVRAAPRIQLANKFNTLIEIRLKKKTEKKS